MFTICIPAYNAERHLEECLLSLREQTNDNYEAIIVNDGSSDRTLDICSKFEQDDPRFRIITTENHGPLLARRAAILAAKGEYLLFLDADDQLRPTAISDCARALNETPADILFFQYSTHQDYSSSIPGAPPSISQATEPSKAEVRKAVLRGETNQLCFKSIKKCLIDSHLDYAVFTGFKHGEDLFQLLPLVDQAKSFLAVNACLYFYRRSDESGTFHFSYKQFEDVCTLGDRLLHYGNKWGMSADAEFGLAAQYCYLIKILINDESFSSEEKRHAYDEICECVSSLYNSKMLSTASIPWRAFIAAASKHCFKISKLMIAIENRIRSRR